MEFLAIFYKLIDLMNLFQGTSCTVSSYYLPSGDLERTEVDIEVGTVHFNQVCQCKHIFLALFDDQQRALFS